MQVRVPVIENVLKANDELAALNRAKLHEAGLLTIDLIGAPGCGKTALLEATLPRLAPLRVGVIAGDMATQRDADRLAPFASQVVQVNTGRGCHLEANHVHEALERMRLRDLDLLFVENVGNLICPVGFDLGQSVKVGLFSSAGGDDKAAKHPHLVTAAGLIVVTMLDLQPHVSFDVNRFTADVRRLNPTVRILRLSARTGEGLGAWVDWLRSLHALLDAPPLSDD
jgi:hydrogenase nickel incorporation protein HypB